MPEVKDIIGVTPLLAFFAIVAFVLLKVLPSYLAHRKELKLAEIGVRKDEAAVRLAGAESIGKLTETMRSSTDATNELRIFLRAVMREHETLRSEQEDLGKRLVNVESLMLQLRPNVEKGARE